VSDAPAFRPFGSTDDEFRELLVLRDGVPPELMEPLLSAVYLAVSIPYKVVSGRYLNAKIANELRALIGIDLGQRAASTVEGEEALAKFRRLSALELLRVTDALLHLGHLDYFEIDRMFALARSKWRVGEVDGSGRLVERVPAGVEEAAMALFASGTTSGSLLHRAFSSAFGLTPNPGETYKMSVKAVETAAHPRVEPRNSGATLGTMLKVMRNAPGAGWTLPLVERADHTGANRELVIALMQSLWDGQDDRHRDGEVSIAESRAAFYAALALVGWFESDAVAQTSP
jgi:hypothetical protein